jgi:hypothetical protein
MSFLSLGAGYLPPTKIIFYTSYVKSEGPQHLEVTMATETGRKYITLLHINPGECPLAGRRLGNRCKQNHCNLCDRSPRVVNNPVSLLAGSNDVDPSAPKPAYTNTSNAASIALKTTAPAPTDPPAPPTLPSAQNGPKPTLKHTPVPTPKATHQHPATEKITTQADNEPWQTQNTKITITRIMHSVVFLFFNKQANYNLLRSCTHSFKLFQLYASKLATLTSHTQNKPKGAWTNTPSLIHDYLPSETDKLSLFRAIRSNLKISAALHASPLLLKSLVKDGLSPIPLNEIEKIFHITFAGKSRNHPNAISGDRSMKLATVTDSADPSAVTSMINSFTATSAAASVVNSLTAAPVLSHQLPLL